MNHLERLITARAEQQGPLGVDAYMDCCLSHPEHGYYTTRDPFGAGGDFTTAPEISQMFGELIGAWLAQVWIDQGGPAPFVLCELGPGRGTLMRDALRVMSKVPGMCQAARLWLVETSPRLRQAQAEMLDGQEVEWTDGISGLPDLPLLVVANEFFDALPVRQFQRTDALWRERLVAAGSQGLEFVWGAARSDADIDAAFPRVPDGTIVELCPAGEAVASGLARRIAHRGGAALVIDYGVWDGTGDSLQALRGHKAVDPLAGPGEADLTAHVRFCALAKAAGGVQVCGPESQGVFLERLGITDRARALAKAAAGAQVDDIIAAHRRLAHPDEMGDLFQVLALAPRNAPPLPGFAE